MEITITTEEIIEYLKTSNIGAEELTAAIEYLKILERDSIKLSYLEAYGVDNWNGYDIAMHEYYNSEEEEE